MRNDPATNGEYWLLEKLVSQSGSNATLLDIGANRGDWTHQGCIVLERYGRRGQIHAFEPTRSTYAFLSNRFPANSRVFLHKTALSERTGTADFFVVGELAGTNSLQKGTGAAIERVQTQTFDDFVATAGLEEILLVKSDTEGHDMSVLRGAAGSLRAGRVVVWQFEYNHRWVFNHSMLKDVFDFIEDKPYSLVKLYGYGLELYKKWHPELERFFEGNYALVRRGTPIEASCEQFRFAVSNVAVSVSR